MPSTRGTERDRRRAALVVEATAQLEDGGPDALRARELTAAVGTSTQALYTLFGGMPGLVDAVVAEGFAALTAAIEATPRTDDAVLDHMAQGAAYTAWALAHPQLYRLMFGVTGDTLRRHTAVHSLEASPQGREALSVLTRSVQRMIDSGRIRDDGAVVVGRQFLAATHGYVLLEIAGTFGEPGAGLATLAHLGSHLLVGLGDDPVSVRRSLDAVLARMGAPVVGNDTPI